VLHVAQAVGGVAHVLDDHVRHQRASGWDVVVACPPGDLDDIASAAGVRVVGWNAVRQPGPSVVPECRALARIVATVEPAVVHLHSAKAGLVGRLVVRGRRRTVYTPHAWSWLAVHGVTRRAARSWERYASRWTDAVVCLSEAELLAAHAAGISCPLELIPNDVPVDAIRSAAPDSAAAARSVLGLEPDAPVVVCCARLAPQKGQDVLLEAWAGVPDRLPGAQLVLVGDGPDRAALESQAAKAKGVRFAGMATRTQALAWMRAATVVVCPSRYEGMALVPLEAAALGVPVIASDVEGMHSELSSWARQIVPVEDSSALRAALARFLGSPEQAAAGGAEARAWADRVLAGRRSVTRTVELYRRILAGPAGASARTGASR
jgi:glycosyltransferase involved in cell wall biosynthesis